MNKDIEYYWVEDAAAGAVKALEVLLETAAAAIAARNRFVLALSGGSTPGLLYQMLAKTHQDWSRWQLIYGDERCLPAEDPERTSTLVQQSWLNAVSFPPGNHHKAPAELGSDAAAQAYATDISALLPVDMALLGMGEDGHTASLFPGHIHPELAVVPVHNSPKPPADRISLSYSTLCEADTVCLLVIGTAKRDALQRWQQGEDLPVARVHGRQKTVLITDTRL